MPKNERIFLTEIMQGFGLIVYLLFVTGVGRFFTTAYLNTVCCEI